MISAQPLSQKTIIRFLLVALIVTLFFAGYYHAELQQEKKRYARIEDAYVRVRGQLGIPETQRLIDESYITPTTVQQKE